MNTEIKYIDIKTKSYLANNWDEGQRIIDVTPDHNRELILMDLNFLIRLIELLPTTSDLSQFKINLKKKITNSQSLEDIVEACVDFSSFHRTIDLIQKHKNMRIDTDEGRNKCDEARLADVSPKQQKPSIEDLGF
tara:strand:- start:2140 stop:2544 length:405 start_codon:yes stop_codon:yes gene_type:complete